MAQFRQAQQLVDTSALREATERAHLLRRLMLLADNADNTDNTDNADNADDTAGAAPPGPAGSGRGRLEPGGGRVPAARAARRRPLGELLDHALTRTSGPRPTKAWLRRTGELLEGRPDLVALLHALLDLAHTCAPAPVHYWYGDYGLRVCQDNADLVRGLLWAAQVSGEPWLVPLVLALEPTLHEPKPLNACYAVLGRRADTDAIAALVQMQRGTRHRGKLKQITAALDEAATAAGFSRSELTELTIPDCGLDRQRQRRLDTAVITVDDRARVGGLAGYDGTTTSSTSHPSAAEAALVDEVRRATTQTGRGPALAGEPVNGWRTCLSGPRMAPADVAGALRRASGHRQPRPPSAVDGQRRRPPVTPACRTRTVVSPWPAARRPSRAPGRGSGSGTRSTPTPRSPRLARPHILAGARAAVQAGVPGGLPADPGRGADRASTPTGSPRTSCATRRPTR